MIWRVTALLVIGWALGFAVFMLSLGKPLDGHKTDAIVVLTGASGRIDRGLTVLRAGDAGRMLVSGVDPDVRPEWRLVNLVMQRRARWLLSRIDDLFLPPLKESS